MLGKVYINHGRIIVDCPYGCNNAYRVKPGQKEAMCRTKSGDGCLVSFPLEIHEDLQEIESELNKRRMSKNRNWFPDDHPRAVRHNLPRGQSVSDLRAEHEMNGGRDGLDNANDSRSQ